MIQEQIQAIEEALRTVPDLRVFDLGASIDPPGAVVGPPALQWQANSPEPSGATLSVLVVVQKDDRLYDRLLNLVQPVFEAIETVPSAVVTDATPGEFDNMPCYEFIVELGL